ncbi:nucleotidyltransferase domain containing protein [Nitzschia inconspicua]|uniref:Nucleotidyltransferase domain containing protein n=1 Tax=Nitzschia inconspicua TaxID=303405 RepID=A0A9K3L264_9STRA|nr:nucleotidyltransferase domain containing protein [Nitzschia inconspicua]
MSSTKQQLHDFQAWVLSLKTEELLDAMAFAFQQQPSNGYSSSSSHEYDLLLEMVRLQSPPPTPIHNKAMGYHPCSQRGARLDYAYREEDRLRWTQPRVFRFRIDEEATIRRSNTTNRRGIRTANTILQQQRRRYKVKASKLVTISPWGEFYGLGSTEEQQQSDENIIRGTRLGRQGMAATASQQQQQQQQPTACFVADQRVGNAKHILRMLKVASRGSFLQMTPRKDDYFYAPWLEPTRCWFTLSKYLASRYELALWESYRRFKRQEASLGSSIRGIGVWNNYSRTVLDKVLKQSLCLGLQDALRWEQAQSQMVFLRDGMIWSLINNCLLNQDPGILASVRNPQLTLEALLHIPLIKVGCPYISRFQSIVLGKFEFCLVKEQEQEATKVGKELFCVTNGGVVGNDRHREKKKKTKLIPADSEGELDDEEEGTGRDLKHVSKEEHFTTASLIDFLDNGTSPRDRNKNIITVLGILDEVLEDAFEKVGLPRTPKFVDQREIDKKKQERKRTKTQLSTHSSHKSDSSRISKTKARAQQKTETTLDEKTPPHAGKSIVTHGSTGVIGRPSSFDLEATEQYRNIQASAPWGIPLSTAYQQPPNQYQAGPYSFAPFPDYSMQYSPHNVGLTSGYQDPFFIGPYLKLGENIGGIGANGGGDWTFLNRYHARDESIFSDLFSSQDSVVEDEDDDGLMAASTAASIASSTYIDTTLIADPEDMEDIVDEADEDSSSSEAGESSQKNSDTGVVDASHDMRIDVLEEVGIVPTTTAIDGIEGSDTVVPENNNTPISEASTDSKMSALDCRSPSPEAPVTPPPTLSPILLSLADLKDLHQDGNSTPARHKRLLSSHIMALPGHGSLPSSPVPPSKNGLTSSWSRDDLRIHAFRDDQRIKQNRRPRSVQPARPSETQTYKAVAVKSLARPIASTKAANVDFRFHVMESSLRAQSGNRDLCARSETALDGEREDQQTWHNEDADSPSMAKDEVTTITSLASQRVESEELNAIREERNNFRDMCLTLGAEVARLKAMLAAQQATAAAPMDYPDAYALPMVYRPGSVDPHGMQPFFRGMNNLRPGPMSDAGFHRGEYESQVSEDDVYEAVSRSRDSRTEVGRRMSSSHTIAGSDASVEFNNSTSALSNGPIAGAIPMYDAIHSHGLQSRLTKDILQFLNATNSQLRKLDGKRKLAVERFSRLVKTIWPRAQVKLYGSYMSGLCLPSSDLDFVVCLPAVHKKDLALAPGVLEGRNAINETSQKLLARELKGESWIDPRSIKLIERTIVPVIKVSTKDTRARVIQLDISFDSPEHHGLEANQMVAAILDELPLIRPLMLVLKRFLLDRGLLTSYTGGLSSYCLFLMLARYLQEQSPSTGDSGSLLMGFLDFYGNFFDPRATGISVMRRQYFARANHYTANGYHPPEQPKWKSSTRAHQRVVVNLPTQMPHRDFRRHNSFSETGSVDGSKQRQQRFPGTPGSVSSASGGGTGGGRVFVPRNPVPPRSDQHNNNNNNHTMNDATSTFDHVRPFTFDPLFVEDPLSASNNVGRNAFRINQVQRAFSDAHRALVASLDWDIHSSADGGVGDYPLLKCLLQGEDVLYEL